MDNSSLSSSPGAAVAANKRQCSGRLRKFPRLLCCVLLGVVAFYLARSIVEPPAAVKGNRSAAFTTPALSPPLPHHAPRLEDVLGCEEAKPMAKAFATLLRDPEAGNRLGLTKSPPGLIFYGPDGTGKRMLAKAIANEGGARFVEWDMRFTPEEFTENNSGMPTVTFIHHRGISGVTAKMSGDFRVAMTMADNKGREEEPRLLLTLMAEHAKSATLQNVLIISVSDKPSFLSPAKLGGTFEKVRFFNPNREIRTALLREKLGCLGVKIDDPGRWYERLTNRTHGMNGGNIARIRNAAALISLSKGKTEVEAGDVEEAVEKEAEQTPRLTEWERRATAIHEAGHAVVGWRQENSDCVVRVSIIPDMTALGYTEYKNKGLLRTDEYMFSRLCTSMAGRHAERLFLGRSTTGVVDDLYSATGTAYLSVAVYGLNDEINFSYGTFLYLRALGRIYGDKVANKIDTDVHALLERASQVTKDLVYEHRNQIERVAETLLLRDSLTYDDLMKLLGPPACRINWEEPPHVKPSAELPVPDAPQLPPIPVPAPPISVQV